MKLMVQSPVRVSRRGVLLPGTEITEDMGVTPAQVKILLDEGALVEVSDEEIEVVEKKPEPVAVEKKPEPVAEQRLEYQGLWNFNPAILAGKDLDTLNVMVLEIDGRVTPFDTVEEATAWLSQDFRG